METAEIIKRNKKGKFKGTEINNRSLFTAFFIKKQNARIPKKAFIGAGAIAMAKGIITIAQYIAASNNLTIFSFIYITPWL